MSKGYLLPKIRMMHPKAKRRQSFTVLDAGIALPLCNTAIKISVFLSEEERLHAAF